ncbi:MAG: hypothetical protein AB7G15_20820, partial [Alphaproteobacteria bacterium]
MSTQASGLAVCTVSSYNYLHFTLNLVRSIDKCWQRKPVIYVVLLDLVSLPRPGFETFENVIFVSADELGIDNLTWLRLKHSAGDLCTIVRPFAVEHALGRGHEQVFYCDADVHFFSDPSPFFAERPAADFVLTPHIVTPMPTDDVWVPLNIGHLTAAGIINAGMFLCRNRAGAKKFLRQHADFMSGPAAFLDELGSVRDQHYFNWVLAFGADVQVSANRRMNVAYWNLHERPVRWARLDGGPADKWSVDGDDLISFHFSGFDWDHGRLSIHDSRPTTTWNSSLYALSEYYRAALRACGESYYSQFEYRFDTLGGTRLTREVRLEFKRSARIREPKSAAWEDYAIPAFGHLNSVIGSRHLLPLYFENILSGRPDLVHASGGEQLHSPYLMWWASHALDREYAVGAAYERYVDFAFHKEFLEQLADAVAPYLASPSLDTVRFRLKSDRRALLDELAPTELPRNTLEHIASAEYRYPAVLPSQCLRLIYEGWATLRVGFPDPLGRDEAKFRAWLSGDFQHIFDVPPRVSTFIETFDAQASLARVIGFARRNPVAASIFRAHGLSKPLLGWLIGLVNLGLGYNADDLMITDWWLQNRAGSEIANLGIYAPDDIGTASGDRYVEAWLGWRKDRAGPAADAQRALERADIAAYVAAVSAGDSDATSPHNDGAAVQPRRREIFVGKAAAA